MSSNLDKNIILNVDSYKTSHYLQYPPNTTRVSSYIESRGGAYDVALMFGLQMFIDEYLMTPINHQHIDEAKAVITAHGLPFNEQGWRYIVDHCQGLLPIEIQALPEGTLVPVKNAMVQVVNTDPNCPWLTSYIETALLRAVWYPTTVATVSWHCRQTIGHYLKLTADNLDGLPFKLHDFGARGATCEQAAAIGGAAHLVNFMGTDTISGLLAAKRYYDAPMAGFSIPAAEHSTITSWGKENETQAYANMLEQFSGPNKLVAVVSDSYDLFHAIDNIWGDTLLEQVKSNGGTVVIRPDSGDPVTIVCQTIERLMAKFGHKVNSKGFKQLPDYIRVIQGDGVCGESIKHILSAMHERQLSAENIAFGMGAELLQKVNRDTLKFAMKTSAVEVDGVWRDVFKDPATDHNKRSKKGRLAVIVDENGQLATITEQALGSRQNSLVTLFCNGKATNRTHFEQIRQRCQYQ